MCVAVLDGRVDLEHPCFDGADLTQILIFDEDPGLDSQTTAHGTCVASVIFGQPGGPVCGIAPRCRGVVIPIYRSDPSGRPTLCSQPDLARAIATAIDAGANVINISGGELVGDGQLHPDLTDVLHICDERDVLVVAAAGNDGCDCVHAPAVAPSVLPVGAMGTNGETLAFSNWGEPYRVRGILAPGQSVMCAIPGDGTERADGTSVAAAVVSGAVALLLSVMYGRRRVPSPLSVRDILLESATGCEHGVDIECHRVLAGRLNTTGALLRLLGGENMEGRLEPSATDVIDDLGVNYALAPQEIEDDIGESRSVGAPGVAPSTCACNGGSACSCGGSTSPVMRSGPTLVYALGQLGYDFGIEARRDSYVQHGVENPHDPAALLKHLERNPEHATSITWTLNQGTTPIYAIQPSGAFADRAYAKICRFLEDQLAGRSHRVSVPGWIVRTTTLMNGHSVPVIQPEQRGMFSWQTDDLVKAVAGRAPRGKVDRAAYDAKSGAVGAFLQRVYDELRNLGVRPEDRALNHAVTNAFQLDSVFASAIDEELALSSIDVERSPIARPGSDSWDVKLTFFQPSRRLERAREVYRFAVDVSDVVPVTVGEVRQWSTY